MSLCYNGRIVLYFAKVRSLCCVCVLCVCVQEMGASVTEEELRELISEVDINKNATIEEEEFLKVYTMCSVCVCVCVGWGCIYIDCRVQGLRDT